MLQWASESTRLHMNFGDKKHLYLTFTDEKNETTLYALQHAFVNSVLPGRNPLLLRVRRFRKECVLQLVVHEMKPFWTAALNTRLRVKVFIRRTKSKRMVAGFKFAENKVECIGLCKRSLKFNWKCAQKWTIMVLQIVILHRVSKEHQASFWCHVNAQIICLKATFG